MQHTQQEIQKRIIVLGKDGVFCVSLAYLGLYLYELGWYYLPFEKRKKFPHEVWKQKFFGFYKNLQVQTLDLYLN